jgi:hypothetical protein
VNADRPQAGGAARTGSIVGIAAVVCIACCLGPILGVLGAIAALGLVSSVLIGAAGLLISAAAVGAFVILRRRRRSIACALTPEPVSVELSRRST